MKKLLLFSFLVLASGITAFSQSWQWGQRGGTAWTITSGYGPDEDITDMTTDRHGNVYVTTNVWNSNPNIAGLQFTGSTGLGERHGICIASFKCDGTLRWVKLMSDCVGKARAIKLDTLGNVYVCGSIYNTVGNGVCKIRSNTAIDTTIAEWPDPIYRTMFLMKLDTNGAYNWIRFPEADTATYHGSGSGIEDMDVDEVGNIYLLADLKASSFANNAFVANHTSAGSWGAYKQQQLYMLKYNTNGVFQSGYHLPYTHKGSDMPRESFKRDTKRHRNIISGRVDQILGDTLYINGQQIFSTYVAAFDDNGNQLWLVQQDSNGQNGLMGDTYNRVAMDPQGNIYYAGWCMGGYSFNGTVVQNFGFGGFVFKLDTAGHNIWVQNSKNSETVTCIQAAVSGNTVAVYGSYATTLMIWGNDTLHRPPNCGYRTYIARLNATTGAVIAVDSLQADCNIGIHVNPASGGGYADGLTGSMAADPFGNFYISGNFNDHVYVGNDTLHNISSGQDWYVAKYGTANCSVPLAVEEISNTSSAEVKVYPNPTTGMFTISATADMAKVEVYNVVGTKVYTSSLKTNKTTIDFSSMVKGIYVYTIQLKQGGTVKGKIIVQ